LPIGVSNSWTFFRNKGRDFTVESTIDVRESFLLGGRKNFALKITVCPKNRQFALKLTFEFNPNRTWNLM